MTPTSSPPSKAPRVSAIVVRKTPAGGLVAGVIAKRTYSIAGGRVYLCDEQEPLVEEPIFDDKGQFVRDSDLILQRPAVDVIVEGHAYSMRGATSEEVRIEVGPLNRRIIAWGPRAFHLDGGGVLRVGSPGRIEKIPLDGSAAYGGVDDTALAEYGDPTVTFAEALGEPIGPEHSMFAYPRNRVGCGYLIDASRAAIERSQPVGLELAEHAGHPPFVVGNPLWWPRAPLPALVGWLPYDAFPRQPVLGLPVPPFDRELLLPSDFMEVKHGLLRAEALDDSLPIPARVDLAGGQSSAPLMRVHELRPGDAVRLDNLHPRSASWRWVLPAEVPRMAFQIPGTSPAELVPRIQLVNLLPDLDRVVIVWVAQASLEQPYTEEQLNGSRHGVVWRTA